MNAVTIQRMKRFAGWAIALTATGIFLQRMFAHADDIPHIAWSGSNVVVAIGSVLLAFAAIAIAGAVWQVLLRDQGVYRRLLRVEAIYLVAQFGKYLPGNVGQYVGRVALAKGEGIGVPVTVVTMVVEVFWSVGTALGVSSLSLFLFVGNRLVALPPWLDAAGMAILFVTLISAPWLAMKLLGKFFPGVFARLLDGVTMKAPGVGAALKVSILLFVSYLCMGLVLEIQARYWFGASPAPLLEVAGFFALAWLAGYLLPGAPAGIGVRESMMLLLLSPLFGEATAIALGVTLRLATTLADAVAFAAGSICRYLLSRGR